MIAEVPGRPPTMSDALACLAKASVVMDCRWLGRGGAGRATEILLQELRASPPPGAWTLWGPRHLLEPFVFEDARISATDEDPRRLGGQGHVLSVPRGDVVLYMHQIRPLRPGRSVTFIYDTIPLRFSRTRAARRAKALFFRLVARTSAHVLTISPFSRDCLIRDLGLPASKITEVCIPYDSARARRIGARRNVEEQEDFLLYVGRFAGHKNLDRLCKAFMRTSFAERGGRLILVGGSSSELSEMAVWIQGAGITRVELHGVCGEAELDDWLVRCRALVLPSFEEGHGLPPFEAAASGIPVAASTTGRLAELPADRRILFDPDDEFAMARALDKVVEWDTLEALEVSQAPMLPPVLRVLERRSRWVTR